MRVVLSVLFFLFIPSFSQKILKMGNQVTPDFLKSFENDVKKGIEFSELLGIEGLEEGSKSEIAFYLAFSRFEDPKVISNLKQNLSSHSSSTAYWSLWVLNHYPNLQIRFETIKHLLENGDNRTVYYTLKLIENSKVEDPNNCFAYLTQEFFGQIKEKYHFEKAFFYALASLENTQKETLSFLMKCYKEGCRNDSLITLLSQVGEPSEETLSFLISLVKTPPEDAGVRIAQMYKNFALISSIGVLSKKLQVDHSKFFKEQDPSGSYISDYRYGVSFQKLKEDTSKEILKALKRIEKSQNQKLIFSAFLYKNLDFKATEERLLDLLKNRSKNGLSHKVKLCLAHLLLSIDKKHSEFVAEIFLENLKRDFTEKKGVGSRVFNTYYIIPEMEEQSIFLIPYLLKVVDNPNFYDKRAFRVSLKRALGEELPFNFRHSFRF